MNKSASKTNFKINSNEVWVNGPINVVRLTGQVGSVSKVIYLFMDVHVNVNYQTECSNIRSIDIDKYLIRTFDEAREKYPDRVYDLFLETGPLYPQNFRMHLGRRGAYFVGQVQHLFHKTITYEGSRIKKSNQLPNVRLHHTDIRDYLTLYHENIMIGIQNSIQHMWESSYITSLNLIRIVDGLKIIHSHISYIYNLIYSNSPINLKGPKPIIFTSDQKVLSNHTEKDFQIMCQILIDKILNKYSNPEVKKIIRSIIKTELYQTYEEFFSWYNKTIQFLNKHIKELQEIEKVPYNKLIRYEREKIYYDYNFDFISILCKLVRVRTDIYYWMAAKMDLILMDLYLLRRFLDKDYVTHSVAYTGASHSVNYIKILVKYFGFKITIISHSKAPIEQLTKIIHKSGLSQVHEIEQLVYPLYLIQCSNMTDFPNYFD